MPCDPRRTALGQRHGDETRQSAHAGTSAAASVIDSLTQEVEETDSAAAGWREKVARRAALMMCARSGTLGVIDRAFSY